MPGRGVAGIFSCDIDTNFFSFMSCLTVSLPTLGNARHDCSVRNAFAAGTHGGTASIGILSRSEVAEAVVSTGPAEDVVLVLPAPTIDPRSGRAASVCSRSSHLVRKGARNTPPSLFSCNPKRFLPERRGIFEQDRSMRNLPFRLPQPGHGMRMRRASPVTRNLASSMWHCRGLARTNASGALMR